MNFTRFTTLAFSVVTVFAASCSSTGYGDPDAVEELTIDFGSTDLQNLAGDMVESLVAAPQLNYLQNPAKGENQKIILFIGGVNNRTSEHIDTAGITDSIKVSLLKSGKFRIVAADQGQDEIGDQVRFQQGSGRVDPELARAFGKQLGAEVILYGNLRSIDKKKGASIESAGVTTRDKYYQFVLEAANVETGELIWAEESEIRKSSRTGVFGR